MKISLGLDGQSEKAAERKAFEHLLISAGKGDWDAKNALIQKFQPLLTSMAEKRTDDIATLNKYMEAGKQGLLTAVRKYKIAKGVDGFRIFAVDYIERTMDGADKGGGFFARLFGPK